MKKNKYDVLGKGILYFLFGVLFIFSLSYVLRVSEDNCISFNPFYQDCMLFKEDLSISQVNTILENVSYLNDLDYRYQIINETLFFSMKKDSTRINMYFKNNTNKIVRY